MHRPGRILHLVFMLFFASIATAQTRPATTTTPSRDFQLDAGRVRLTIPDGWERVGDADPKGLSVTLQRKTGPGLIAVAIDVQRQTVPPEQARRIGKAIEEKTRASAEQNGVQLIYGPKIEKDDRFFLKVNTRMDVPERGIVDETRILRVMGLNLVNLYVTTDSDSADEARAVRETAEELLAGARMGSGPRPSSFGRTKIKVFVPADWNEQRSDNPNGDVATWREPKNGPARIVLKSRVLPKDARGDASSEKRDVLLDELVKADNGTPPIPGLTSRGEPETSTGEGTIARKIRRSYEQNGKLWTAESRYFVVGDVVLSLTGAAPDESTTKLTETIDEMASKIETLDKPPTPK